MQYSFLIDDGSETEGRQSLRQSSTSLSDLLQVCQRGDRVRLQKDGQDAAVLLSIEEYKQLKALEKLAADPEALQAIVRIKREVAAGDLSNFTVFYDSDTNP